jgi:regulator of sigma E protease
VPSSDWSQGERGLLFEPAVRYHRATGLGDALLMAVNQELYYADFIYTSLKNLVTRPRTVLHLSGPLSIAATSYQVANNNIYDYIVFLGILNVNLAIVNFLPIPVLDGGHMVFLIYEGVRRKPPSERWRVGLTVAGLFFILGLMLFVVGLDVLKYFF